MMKPILFAATGIVFFLFGMVRLSETVQQNLTSSRIREYFSLAVRNRVYGIVTGILTTILLQSSSATSVLTVGLASAGLISFASSIGIILGSDIGTTLTVQFVVWKVTDLSPLFIILGSIVWVLGRGKVRYIGEALFHFGLIFFGISLVSTAAEPLKENEALIRFLREAHHPLWGMLAGLAVTAVIQSSAITISVLAILGAYGVLTIETALPVVFGANIGTAATALLASLTANIEGRKCAVAHVLMKVCGAAVSLALFHFFIRFLVTLTPDIPQQIAYGHFLFNLLIVLIFAPLMKPFAALVDAMLPGKGEFIPIWPEYLDEKCLQQANDALRCVRRELEREMMLAKKMCEKGAALVVRYRGEDRKDMEYLESVVDNLRREIGNYLCDISLEPLSQEFSQRLFSFSAIADDTERIADHALTLAKLAERKHARHIAFTEFAYAELREITDLVNRNLADAMSLIAAKDGEKIRHIIEREDHVDMKIKEARARHLERHYRRICEPEAGPIYIDVLIHLERISDHCENIAEHVRDIEEF